MDFTGKVAVVTGGASGIGLACCQGLVKGNGAVAVVDRNEKLGQQAVEDLRRRKGNAEFFTVDVSARAQVEKAVSQIAARFGGIDILINNAGIQRYAMVTTASEEDWDEVLNVNLKSAFLMSKYVIPEMIKRGGGAIVITGSAQSVAAQRNSVHYVVSKHGLLGLARCLAVDYAKQNIRANCVLPGAVDTPMLRWSFSLDPNPERVREATNKLHLRGKMAQPEEVANVILFLASDLASFVTGAAVMADGGVLVPVGGTANQEEGTGVSKT